MHTIKTFSKSVFAALILASTSFYATTAAAATFDAKSYSGASCQAALGSQVSNLQHTEKGTFNISSVARTVICPIVRDNTVNTNGTFRSTTGAGTGVQVFVENSGAPNTLICTLSSNDKFGNLILANSAPSPVGLNTLGLNVGASAVPGNYVLSCVLPPKSSIRGYQVFEYLNTDADS